jgi:hypothetical protein
MTTGKRKDVVVIEFLLSAYALREQDHGRKSRRCQFVWLMLLAGCEIRNDGTGGRQQAGSDIGSARMMPEGNMLDHRAKQSGFNRRFLSLA